MMAGPDYSIVHPGIFPHNTEASELANIRQWLEFDHEVGWGTDEFQADLPEGYGDLTYDQAVVAPSVNATAN